jgi:PIN domain nuclease of toxin-antitoxin system
MKYLLDTHTYFWARSSPKVLPKPVIDLLLDSSTEIYISVVTPLELAIKTSKGQLNARALLIDFESREIAAGFTIASITVAQAIRSGLLPSHHRDPWDRLLISQSLDLQMPIVSMDKTFDLYGVQRIWD